MKPFNDYDITTKPKAHNRKSKKHYEVYRRIKYQFGGYDGYSELITDAFNEYEFIGSTWAVSEAQAINNVRHRIFGDN